MKILRVVLVLFAIVALAAGGLFWYINHQKSTYYADTDTVRLKHLQYYAELINDYHAKTGSWPLLGRSRLPVYVHIANSQQTDDIKGGPTYDHAVVSTTEFFSILGQTLGRRIPEKYDPQYEPSGRPNFYIYMIHRDAWYFAIHLHEPIPPLTQKIGNHYHKLEISNRPNPPNRAVSASDLLASEAFRRVVSRPLSKPGYFDAREIEHGQDSENGAGDMAPTADF